jgi:hypothetical protein
VTATVTQLPGPMSFRCDLCSAVYDHPRTIDDCPSVEGRCGHLMGAGWRPVWVRIELDNEASRKALASRRKPRSIALRGGWICPQCHGRYTPKGKR